MAEEKSDKVVTLSMKVTNEVKDRFNELKDEGAFDTACMFMETLLERYSNPMKINKENENVIATSKKTIEQLSQELETAKAEISKKNQEIESLNSKFNALETESAQAIEDLNSGFASKNASMMKDHILVPISPLERKCLEYLTEREKKERKRNDITPEVFFMYCLSEMLIKGNKFSIKCVPDSVIAKLQKEVDNGNE